MKTFKNLIFNKITSVLAIAALVISCESTELDLLDSPNVLQPNQADVDLFLNAIQLSFADFVEDVHDESSELVRMKHMFGPIYANAYGPTTFDGTWSHYNRFLADVRAMTPLANESSLFIHSGIGKVLEAYFITSLVDIFGDVPYSEAVVQGNLNPNVDSGADIYAAALTLIDDAIADFNRNSLATPTSDLFYSGDASKWIRFANSLKLKLYLTTGLVNAGTSTSGINALISGNNLIDATSDFEFPYGTNVLNPDSRHPLYGINYDNGTSAAHYMTTGFMFSMILEKGITDPRTRYYFYRQTDANTTDVNEQGCISQPKPSHYSVDDPYCNISHPADSNGYWGRDHGNDAGIPPDDFLKTTYGVYPVGGRFDADFAEPVEQGAGFGGSGITPIILASDVWFMRAAAAIELGTSDNPRAMLEAGIRASMNKVLNFKSIDASEVVIPDDPDTPLIDEEVLAGTFIATQADVDVYVNTVLFDYDTNATTDEDRLNIIIKEHYLASFGNGAMAYNNYRRTSLPRGLQPTLLPNPGAFMRTFLYPSDLVNLNINVDQKSGVDLRTFWDTNSDPLN